VHGNFPFSGFKRLHEKTDHEAKKRTHKVKEHGKYGIFILRCCFENFKDSEQKEHERNGRKEILA